MAKQVISGEDAYATIDDMVERFDERPLADLLSDDETPAAVTGNARLGRMLKIASGKVETAFLMGKKYEVADLQALADSDTNGREFLADIVCAIAYGLLLRRRGDAEQDTPPEVEEANQILNAAVEGSIVLPFGESVDAGVMHNEQDTPEDVEFRDSSVVQAERLFGVRGNRRRRE